MICPLDSTNSLRTDLSEGRNLSPFSAMRRLRALLRARSWAPSAFPSKEETTTWNVSAFRKPSVALINSSPDFRWILPLP